MLEDELKKDSKVYDKWYLDFGNFIKEGVMQDFENKD